SPIRFVNESNNTTCAIAPTKPPPVIIIAISFGVNPNLLSTNKLNKESNAANPKDAIKIIINAIKYKGLNTRFKHDVFSLIKASLRRCGSCKYKKEIIAAINATIAAAKNGILEPNSAKNPPIPGPIIKPVEIAADIYPIAFAR